MRETLSAEPKVMDLLLVINVSQGQTETKDSAGL